MSRVKHTCIIIFIGNGDLMFKNLKFWYVFLMKNTMTMYLLSAKAYFFHQKQHVNFRALKNNLIKILLFRTCSSSLHWHNKKINGVKTDNKNGWVNR